MLNWIMGSAEFFFFFYCLVAPHQTSRAGLHLHSAIVSHFYIHDLVVMATHRRGGDVDCHGNMGVGVEEIRLDRWR